MAPTNQKQSPGGQAFQALPSAAIPASRFATEEARQAHMKQDRARVRRVLKRAGLDVAKNIVEQRFGSAGLPTAKEFAARKSSQR